MEISAAHTKGNGKRRSLSRVFGVFSAAKAWQGAWAVVLGMLLWAANADAVTHRILSMEVSSAPRVEDGRVFFTLEILFDSRPANFWMYHDKANKRLAIEIFDANVSAGAFRLPRRSPFGSPRIETFTKHRKSITGEHAIMYFPLDSQWQCSAKKQGDATIIVEASKKLSRSLAKAKTIPGFVAYPIIAALAGVATLGIILLLNERG